MDNVIRFVCPECEMPVDQRKEELVKSISTWINSEALYKMVSAFGETIPNGSLRFKIDWLNEFANVWDYRKKHAQESERWCIEEDPALSSKEGVILDCVKQLGLANIEKPLQVPDFILPLGGARLSNFARPKKAKEVIDELNLQNRNIVALSGTRPINEVERPFLMEYAPNAITEYDAICSGMEKAFSIRGDHYYEEKHSNSNINLCWAKRTYDDLYLNNIIISMAAPSSDPIRRANSRDTFVHFLDEFRITQGARLLLVTSCIYVPFQLLRFMDLAIERGFYVDCVGMPNNDNAGVSFSQITNYCQETKATINAIKSISDKWL